ncbi:MAG TPA: acetate kinase [Lapidilactobacillus dextrinicus]|uniref:Acetate kinase n=2 Tax=Lapidilactobacillus dextrinicus TaxID=51664 RepID=A0A0R2BU56_9LACO|nr:acetate kinase [Lapidilactobacillus dextrinicus]KRM79510.1 acetate kinase [Lapidilactobacillus dextrinicus DSM 20335]QFG46657.1 acetate kinase [Lapidilactobacillus dextrinicus]HJE15774.1 acetate kinase [Lapidilactobacillus dextrinicus]
MVKVLAINAGSSTLKWKLFEMPQETEIASGMVDRLGLPGSKFIVKFNGQKTKEDIDIPNQDVAVNLLLQRLSESGIIDDINEIKGVGHRVVAGGEFFKQSAEVTPENLEKILELADYAPLHNPNEAKGIEAFQKALPDAKEVAVFDTSFHTSMPNVNYLYSLPLDYYKEYGARKYGAHGTSHRYVSQRAAEILGVPLESQKMITMHLGSGASITAIKDGKSFDTSMGFTPLAGLTMSTRSGDIDASLVAYLMEKLNIQDINDMINILNQKSGLLGISGLSPDMRDLLKTREDRPESQLAIDIYVNRLIKYIGSYVAEMNGVDTLVFTAGTGEGSIPIRKMVVERLGFIGAKLDEEANNVEAEERIISTPDSKVKVLIVPTNEELMIVRDTVQLTGLV